MVTPATTGTGLDKLRTEWPAWAPGVAGAQDNWLAGPSAESASQAPGLWRIGSVTVGGQTYPVGVPWVDESHLRITSTEHTRSDAESLIEALLLRTVRYYRPGQVHVHVWDPSQHTGALPGLYPLTRTGLLTMHNPDDLAGLLEDLATQIRRVHARTQAEGYPSLKTLSEATGQLCETRMVVALLGNGEKLSVAEQREYQRVLRSGPSCGISVVELDLPGTIPGPFETFEILPPDDPRIPPKIKTSMTANRVAVHPDPPLTREETTRACHTIVDEHETLRSQLSRFADLLPPAGLWGAQDSRRGLVAPLGFDEGQPVEVHLDDASPHALIAGPSGSGKTNLILALIASLTTRYDPDELELYLLDFKEGVSFAQFGPGRRDPTWLPHARLIGVNINADREFGLGLLRHLADELRRRATEAKVHEVSKLEELRTADPDTPWPRIVAVIDEFQWLFNAKDDVTKEAVALLEDVARRGRSQGIHLVLASQDVSGIEAFWGRQALWEQFVLRIGLPRAQRVLAQLNDATLALPNWHAVVNHASGMKHGNAILRIPDASTNGTVSQVQQQLYAAHHQGRPEPRLFDGSKAPRGSELTAGVEPGSAVLGQHMDVAGSPAVVTMAANPGRNVGVVSTSAADAVKVLHAAVSSLSGLPARFLLAPLVPESLQVATATGRGLRDAEIVRLSDYQTCLEQLAKEVTTRLATDDRDPVYLVVYGADAADEILDKSGTEALRKLLKLGPQTGVHVIGWWRSSGRLKAQLGTPPTLTDLGVLVGCDVQGSDLGQLFMAGGTLPWSPRPGRAVFFDRTQHTKPEVIIVPEVE